MAVAPPERVGLRLASAAAVFSTAAQRLLEALGVSNGLIRKSRAPARMARTASGISALPLITITGVPGAWRAGRVEDLEAAHARHPQVGEDHVEPLLPLLQHPVAADTVNRHDLVAGGAEDPPQTAAKRVFIVAEEESCPSMTITVSHVSADSRQFFVCFIGCWRTQRLCVDTSGTGEPGGFNGVAPSAVVLAWRECSV